MIQHIVKPFSVAGRQVTSPEIRRAVKIMLDYKRFSAMDCLGAFYGGALETCDRPVWAKQEAMNRLCQRLRKLCLIHFDRGYWSVLQSGVKPLRAATETIDG